MNSGSSGIAEMDLCMAKIEACKILILSISFSPTIPRPKDRASRSMIGFKSRRCFSVNFWNRSTADGQSPLVRWQLPRPQAQTNNLFLPRLYPPPIDDLNSVFVVPYFDLFTNVQGMHVGNNLFLEFSKPLRAGISTFVMPPLVTESSSQIFQFAKRVLSE